MEARTQVGALCWRIEAGRPQVLLVTSRDTGRWVIPKGWPMKGRTDAEAARREAWEEAGAEGKIDASAIGNYAYHKVMGEGADVPCVVSVYALQVRSLAEDFPEARERERRWFAPKKAAENVVEPELRAMLLGFDPQALHH